MRRMLIGMIGVSISLGATGCGTGLAVTRPGGMQTLQAGTESVQTDEQQSATDKPVGPRTRQIMTCTRDGAKIAALLAQRLVMNARETLGLQAVFSDADVAQAQPIMARYLANKLGDELSVCMHATTTGVQRLDDRFSDAAAASLMGLLAFNATGPEIVLPQWMTEYLIRRMVTAQQLPGFLDSLGVPETLATEIKSLLDSTRQPAPISIEHLDRVVKLAAIIRHHLHNEAEAKESKPPERFLRQAEAMRKARADADKAKTQPQSDGHGIILVLERAPVQSSAD